MSKRICGKCKSAKVVDLPSYAGSSFYKCETCGQMGMQEKFPEITVFHRITASPEVLAKELVTLDCDSLWFAWVGIGRREAFSTRDEAIAATVAKLKEVCDE